MSIGFKAFIWIFHNTCTYKTQGGTNQQYNVDMLVVMNQVKVGNLVKDLFGNLPDY